MKSTFLRVALVVALSTAVGGYAEAGQRRHGGGGGGGGGGHASPPSGGGGGGGGTAVARGGSPSGGGGEDRGGSSSGQRSGGGRVYSGGGVGGHGYAVPRGTVRPPWRPGGEYNFYRIRPYGWYYNPWGWGTFGFGYIWDPFWWGYPYGGYGYGYPGWGGGYYGGGGGYAYRVADEDKGGVRIKVKPKDAEVLVDGYFYGKVDDFDGSFQKLKLEKGAHNIELRLAGFQPLDFKVFIVAGETITYEAKMKAQ